MPFADYKKTRKLTEEKIDKKFAEINSNPFEDDRFWSLTVDAAGNGSAIIRLLPAKDGEDLPFVRIWEHKFQGPGGWYMEMCLTTDRIDGKAIGKDPVCEDNHDLWASEDKDNRAIVSGVGKTPGRKRKLSFISNIRVIKDPAHPENNGKVFLFRFGAQIFEIIQAARNPEVEDDIAINAFDMFEGANFNLIAKIDKGYRSYKSSKFAKQTPVDTEKKMEEIYANLYSLNEFISDDKFKSEEVLKARFDKVLGNSKRVPALSKEEKTAAAPRNKTKNAPIIPDDDTPPFEISDEDSGDMLAKFKELAS